MFRSPIRAIEGAGDVVGFTNLTAKLWALFRSHVPRTSPGPFISLFIPLARYDSNLGIELNSKIAIGTSICRCDAMYCTCSSLEAQHLVFRAMQFEWYEVPSKAFPFMNSNEPSTFVRSEGEALL